MSGLKRDYIKKERLLEEFLRLTEIDSESFHEREMADYLKRTLEEMGIDAHEDDAAKTLSCIGKRMLHAEGRPSGNLWACLQGNLESREENREKAILLSAHMDTVSPGQGKKALLQEDGTITSDGRTVLGADDASGIAEILEVLRILKENPLPHPDIELLFTAAEEPYCQGSRLFEFHRFHAKRAYVLDMSGSIGTAALAAPAIYSLYVRVHGKSAHAGFSPEEGIHAIYIAAKAIAELPYGHAEEDTTINFGTVQGGQGKNIVPEEVVLTGELRSMDSEKAKSWIDRIRTTFETYARELGGTVDFKAEKEFDAYRVREENAVAQTFREAAESLGLTVQFADTFGGSDNNNFQSHGIDGIVLANAMKDVHTVRESTHLDEMADCVDLILEIIHKT